MTDPLVEALGRLEPPVRPPRLGPGEVSYLVDDTAIGRMLLAVNEVGALLVCSFAPDEAAEGRWLERLSRAVSPRVLRDAPALDRARRELEDYLAGRRRGVTVATDLTLASPFQQEVLGRLGQWVGYGERVTYGDLARRLERPTASRAVGAALGANPLCVVVPCHRVVASSGALTGYAGGLAAKDYLLELEAGSAGR
jgi:methylated-DNA-[protein]-cysteine S-methyltransferase